MGRRKLEKDYSAIKDEEEINAVKDCFNKYITSDKSGKKHVRGRGLTKVVSIIGKIGFIQVRTGRVFLKRNFFKNKLDQNEIESESIIFDHEHTPKVEGTLITIIYPFTYK
jgi:hypothetical protein